MDLDYSLRINNQVVLTELPVDISRQPFKGIAQSISNSIGVLQEGELQITEQWFNRIHPDFSSVWKVLLSMDLPRVRSLSVRHKKVACLDFVLYLNLSGLQTLGLQGISEPTSIQFLKCDDFDQLEDIRICKYTKIISNENNDSAVSISSGIGK